MKKICFVLCILYVITFLGCSHHEQPSALSLAPDSYQACAMKGNQLIFPINGSIYYMDMDNPQLQKAGDDSKVIEHGTYLHANGDSGQDPVYLTCCNNNEICIEELSEEYTRNQVLSVNTGDYLGACRVVIYQNVCYYTKDTPEGMGGFGVSLKKFSLKEGDEPELIHVWAEYSHPVHVTSMYRYGKYLFLNIPGQASPEKLWVYDMETQEMILQGEATMAYATYNNGKLYYIDHGAIYSYDLNRKKELPNPITIPDYVEGMTLACDHDYLYVNQSPISHHQEQSKKGAKVWVFNYDGSLAGIIDLAGNTDAITAEIATDPFQCVYLCSTDQYIFVGKTGLLITPGIFYVEKSQLETVNTKIHTMYLN
ncbi:MAG: hypothetical protein HFI42_14000 [Lachnospiraceae bacterium]|nr:hypothetical protein [Lachnospiraceae bacterium]